MVSTSDTGGAGGDPVAAPSPDGPATSPWPRLLSVLLCPVCGQDLALIGDGSLRCERRHTFDRARQGYVSLLTGNPTAGNADTAAMVQARAAFLAAGHYAPLIRAVAAGCARWAPADGTLLEAGVGTGHYLASALDALPRAVGLGMDASKFALRRAARAHPRGSAVSWDVWRPLPVRTGSVDLVLNIFAPRNGDEFHRVLRPSGALLVVTPLPDHLAELRRDMGLLSVDAAKERRLERSLAGRFRLQHSEVLRHTVALPARDVRNAVAMGPTARHVPAEDLAGRVARLAVPLSAVTAFRLSVYRPT